MRNVSFNKGQVAKYLVWTFGLAWAVQFAAAPLYRANPGLGQLVLAAMMFVPALGVVLAGGKLADMGWKPQIKKNLRSILIAWLAPMALTVLGAALYFLFFPGHFDLTGAYLKASGGEEALKQLAAQGLSYPMYVLVSAVSAVTYGPLINTFFALGEEIGWRGFLYPRLKARFGRRHGWLLGGAIWGAWHWPLIALIGYEYGAAAGNAAGYPGFPATGMLLFCVVTVAWGILHDWLYEQCGCIWAPALLHGAINAAAAIPLTVCLPDTGFARLLGPAPVGLIAALPYLIAAAAVFLRKKVS